MLQDTITEFGESIGIKDLNLSNENVVQISIEGMGDLYIEDAHPDALIMLMKPVEKPSLELFKRALTLCHYRQKNAFMTSPGLFEDDKLVFIIRLPLQDITKSNLDKALEFLHKLHSQVLEIDQK